MTVDQIVDLLNPKNQNLPKIELTTSFGKSDVMWVPVMEKKEAEAVKQFPFIKKSDVSGKKGEKKQVIHQNQLYYFVGVGTEKEVDSRKMRRFYGSVYLASIGTKPKSISMAVDPKWVKEATVGVHVAALNPKLLNPNFRKEGAKKNPAPRVELVGNGLKTAASQKAHKAGLVLAEGKNVMRLLGAMPPNVLNQKTYAEVVVKLAKQWRVPCERVPKNKLKNYQMLNAVSQGSENDSELLIFTLKPKHSKTKAATAVVGKGICYDSGGLIGKQDHMKSMKEDMAGSASVLATVLNIAKGGYEVKQTTYVLMALAENMMGQGAMRADDLYITGDGKQVEIAHTDAEGRLVMGDAICYAKNNFKNIESVFTIATLTGSCVLALGDVYTGMVCNSDMLAKKAKEIGEKTGEYAHRAPWNMDYDDNHSPYADVSNLSPNSREAGWIKAGLFLYRFVPEVKKDQKADFCHFDIAGSIDMEGKQRPWRQKGLSSGVGVGLLTGLLTK